MVAILRDRFFSSVNFRISTSSGYKLFLTYVWKHNFTFVVLQVISTLIGMLRNALGQSDLQSELEGSKWTAHEIADGLGNLVFNENNMEVMLDRGIVPLLISLIGKGGPTEKECAANTLWAIAKNTKGKAKIMGTANAVEELARLSKCGNQSLQEAAKRVLLELKETRTTGGNRSVLLIIMCYLELYKYCS